MAPVIELYSSIECPFAYLAVHRLRQIWSEFPGRVQIVWQALSLEYINRQVYPKPLRELEIELLKQIDPSLPARSWNGPDWKWPATFWPAFEALACAQAQGHDAAFELSWQLRQAYFQESRTISLRHEILEIARPLAEIGLLDMGVFQTDWDSGRYKESVLRESQRGWHDLKVKGSPTFVFRDRTQISNPAIGEMELDEENAVVRSFTPYSGDSLEFYRMLLLKAISLE
jgi:predicted DsbA family dithiol-disulfide isomerase